MEALLVFLTYMVVLLLVLGLLSYAIGKTDFGRKYRPPHDDCNCSGCHVYYHRIDR